MVHVLARSPTRVVHEMPGDEETDSSAVSRAAWDNLHIKSMKTALDVVIPWSNLV